MTAEGDLVVADTGNNVIRIALPPDRDPAGLVLKDVVKKKAWLDDADALKRGKADMAKVAEVIKGSTEDLSNCLAKSMEGERTARGSMTAFLFIGEDGAVKDYDLKDSTLNSRNLEACVLNLAPKWKFPAPSKGGTAVVTHTFSFGK